MRPFAVSTAAACYPSNECRVRAAERDSFKPISSMNRLAIICNSCAKWARGNEMASLVWHSDRRRRLASLG